MGLVTSLLFMDCYTIINLNVQYSIYKTGTEVFERSSFVHSIYWHYNLCKTKIRLQRPGSPCFTV